MIPTIRLHSQQLINPVFNNPKDLVSWMGGIQAQDYTMSKWVGCIFLIGSGNDDIIFQQCGGSNREGPQTDRRRV